MSERSVLFHKDSSKSRQRFKEALGKSRQFETICLNKSQLKHMHAIRPYSSKERKSSRRDSRHNQSPHELSRSKSKRLDNSCKKNDELPVSLGGRQLTEMYGQLISLKSQYKMLKSSYIKLQADKKEAMKKSEEEKMKIVEQLQQSQTEVERLRRNNGLLEKEIDRIKKQCIKIVEMERFKVKKLEQTLQEKQLMIAFLRNSLEQMKKGESNEHQASLFFLQNSLPLSFDYFSKQPNISSLSRISSEFQTHKGCKNGAIIQEDSLSFSRDKSKETDSIIHSFLSHDQSILNHNFAKKENILINSLNESPITQQIQIIDEISEKSQKSMSNPQSSQFQAQRYSIHTQEHQGKYSIQNKQDIIHLQQKDPANKHKVFSKRLQIHLTDENVDLHNIGEDLSMETKKKAVGSGFACRQKKKHTVKKPKQI